MSAVEFVFSLLDKFSGPAKNIAKESKGATAALKETAKASDEVDKAVKKTKKGGEGAGQALKDTARKAELLPGRLGKVQEAVKDTFGDKSSERFARFVKGTANAGDAAAAVGVSFQVMKKGAGVAKDGAAALGSGLASLAGMAAAAGAAVAAASGGLVVAGARMALDAMSFKQSTQFALKYSLGSAEAAGESYRYTQNIARVLGDSARGVAEQLQGLVREGFGAGDAETIAQLGADLRAMNGGREVQMGGVVNLLKSLQKQGSLDGGGLDALLAALPAQGQFGGKVVETLAKRLGVNEKDARLREQKVRAQLGGNKLRGQKGVDAVFEAVLAVSGEKKIGAAAKSFADTTVEGSLKKVKANFENLFDSINSTSVGKSLVTLLNKVAGALDPTTESGKKTLAILDKMASAAGRLIDQFDVTTLIDGLSSASDAVSPLVDLVEAFGGGALDGFKEASSTVLELVGILSKGDSGAGSGLKDTLKDIGKVAGYVAVGVVAGIGAIVAIEAKLAGLAVSIFKPGVEVGLAIIDGIAEGLATAKSKLVSKLEDLASLLPDSVRKLLQIHSPSRVFAEIGANVSLGLAEGIEREAPTAQASARAVISPELGEGGSSLVQRMGRAGPLSITVYVQGGPSTKETADAAVRGVVDALEQLGIVSGAVGAT